MSDSDLQITFSADASGVVQGADQVNSSLGGIGPKIQELGKSFADLAASLKGGVDGIGKIGTALSDVGKGGAQQLQGVAVSLKSLNEVIAGVGQSAPGSLRTVSTAASELAVNLSSSAVEGAGKLGILGEAAGGVAGVAAAVAQVALNAAAATAEWAARTANSSTASAEARQNAANLNDTIGQAQTAFSQVGDTLANAFAPVLTTVVSALTGLAQGFAKSYQEGGTAKGVVDALILGFKLLAAGVEIAIGVVIAIIDQVRADIQQWKDNFEVAKDDITVAVDILKIEFQTLGKIVGDVLSGDFSKAVGDFKSGLADMEQQTQKTVVKINTDLAKIGTDQLASAKAVLGDILGGSTDVGNLFGDSPTHSGRGNQPKSAHASHGGGQASAAAKSPAASTPASDCRPTTACVDQAKKNADQISAAKVKAAQIGVAADEKAAEDGLSVDKENAKAKIEIIDQQEKEGVISATSAASQRAAVNQGVYADEQATEEKIYDLKVEALKREEALGDISLARKAEIDAAIQALETEHQAKMNTLRATANAETIKDNLAVVSAIQSQWNAVVNPLVSSFTSGLVQMAEGTKSFVQVMRSMGQQILNDFVTKIIDPMIERWLWKEAEQTVATFAGEANRQLAQVTSQNIFTVLENQAVVRHQLAELAKTGATTGGVAARSAATAGGATVDMAATGTAALADIGTSAAKAAAATWAAIVQAFGPLGPFVAPVFAGAALAAVLDFRGLVRSAAGGFDIPAGLNPLTQLHAQEMVLPARFANPLRDMLSGYQAANSNLASVANDGGDTHAHFHVHGAMDGPSFRNFLRDNSDHLSTVLQEMGRRGQKTG